MSDQTIQIYVRDPDGAAHWVDLRFLLDVGTPVLLTINGVEHTLTDLSEDRRSVYFTRTAQRDGLDDAGTMKHRRVPGGGRAAPGGGR